jgi:DNA polymerase-1
MNPELILVDGSAFLFRGYFANLKQNLTNNEGFPTGAMFGVISSIKKLENQYKGAKIIMIFDAKGKNHRHEIYPEYKANRKPAEEDLVKQIAPLYEIINNMGYHFLCVDNVEADDVIATLAKKCSNKGVKTLIASGDKDLMQLVGDNVWQMDMKGNLLDYQGVIDKQGIKPEQIMDLLALSGDSADNIPGVPSVGPKTAIKWLEKYGDIATIKTNADEIGGKVGEKLRDNFDKLDLSHKLVELKFDVELSCDIFENPPQANTEKLAELYQKYGFNAWLNRLDTTIKPLKKNAVADNNNQNNNENILAKYQQKIIWTSFEFDNLLDKLNNAKSFTFDLETTGLNYIEDTIVGLVFLVENTGYYVPIAHNYLGVPDQIDGVEVLSKITSILENPNIGKIGQNLKYDSHILKNHNINLEGIIADTMLMSYCLNSTATKHNMDDLASFYLNYQTTKFSDVAGSGKNQLRFDEIDIQVASKYAIEDVFITFELFQTLSNKLIKHPTLYKLYQLVELPLIPTMVRIERNGVNIDSEKLLKQNDELLLKIADLKTEIFEIAGVEFNIDSPKQLKEILFDSEGLNLQSTKKTKGGALSTNEETLKSLEHPIAELILEYRSFNKLSSTYLAALPSLVNAKTKRLHTSYHQSGTATGRLSSSKPNLQNIPIRTTEGAKIREAFIAKENHKIIALDYSQVELRIMAHISGDENLIKAFKNGEDVHKSTASNMFKVEFDKVDETQRRNAKAINFGLMYGMGPFNLAKQIGVSNSVAKEYIADYFESYSGVKNYMDSVEVVAKEQGFVETIMGRRLYVPGINSKSKMSVAHALRTAINAPMQGSSADIIKKSMLEIDKKIKGDKDIKMIMQVHDELVFEVRTELAEKWAKDLQEIMQNIVELKVPLIVDYGIADNWGVAH